MKTRFIYSACFLLIGLFSGCVPTSLIGEGLEIEPERFPGRRYVQVLYLKSQVDGAAIAGHHRLEEIVELLDPPSPIGKNVGELYAKGWELHRKLSISEITHLQEAFVEQRMKSGNLSMCQWRCDPNVYNQCVVFLSARKEVVGSIHFCPQGTRLKAWPRLLPEDESRFYWSKKGYKAFAGWLASVEAI